MSLFDPPESRTERLVLSPVAPSDQLAARRLFVDDPRHRYVGWKPLTDDERARRFLESEVRAWSAGDACRAWMARRHDTGHIVGFVIARHHGDSAEFSYVVDSAHWNMGYATEMAMDMLERARRDPEVKEMWAVCDVENHASRRVLEKAGMVLDRTLPGHQRHNIDTEPRDCLRFRLRFEPSLIIRPAASEDATTAGALSRRAYAAVRQIYRPTADALEREKNDSEYITLVGAHGRTVVAVVEYRTDDTSLHARGLAVDPAWQGRGFARQMMDGLVRIAREGEKRVVSLFTIRETGNVEMFEKLGFHAVQETVPSWCESDRFDELHEVRMDREVT